MRKICVGLLLIVALSPQQSFAQSQRPPEAEIAIARRHYHAGKRKLDAGEFAGALALFRIADSIVAVPTARLRMAEAMEGLGRLVEARNIADSVRGIPPAAEPNDVLAAARVRAAALVKRLEARIGRVSFSFKNVEQPFELVLDGEAFKWDELKGVDVDPGAHTVRLSSAGHEPLIRSFDVTEGASVKVELALQQDPTVPSNAPLKAPDEFALGAVVWSGIAMAGAGLLTGAVAGGMALSRAAAVEGYCAGVDEESCRSAVLSNGDAIAAATGVSVGGFVVAGVGVGLGLIGLLVVDVTGADDTAIAPVVGPGFVGVKGTF